MESALEVLSRAATMVNANSDARLSITKELPTTKWRRDRRIRLSSEYHNHESVGNVKPLGESNQTNNVNDNSMEIPLDMSVGASKPPPPPYREPLPGSTFSTMARPSVITQAPKREIISNQENKESPKKKIDMFEERSSTESISMVDPVIDEHFRRSLGADYMNLFGKKLDQLKMQQTSTSSPLASPASDAARQSASPHSHQQSTQQQKKPLETITLAANSNSKQYLLSNSNTSMEKTTTVPKSPIETNPEDSGVEKRTANIAMSVDDHFAKALGDTWKQLQQGKKPDSTTPSQSSDNDDDFDSADDIDEDGDDIDEDNMDSVESSALGKKGPKKQSNQR